MNPSPLKPKKNGSKTSGKPEDVGKWWLCDGNKWKWRWFSWFSHEEEEKEVEKDDAEGLLDFKSDKL